MIDRTLAKAQAAKAGSPPAKAPRRAAGKLGLLLDALAAPRALASCRSRLLFESGPVLFFADVPAGKLKQRNANKFRRDLIAIGLQACVLRARPECVTLMVWPVSEAAITDFVCGAGPDHKLHKEFAAGAPAAKPAASQAPDRAPAREARLLREIAALQAQVDSLTRAQSARGAMEQLGIDDARLKSMLKLLHPDKHGNSEAANEAAKWLNSMRDILSGKAG